MSYYVTYFAALQQTFPSIVIEPLLSFIYIWQPATLLKVNLLRECFSYFLNFANGIKLHKALDMFYCLTHFMTLISLWFSNVFRGYRNWETSGMKWCNQISPDIFFWLHHFHPILHFFTCSVSKFYFFLFFLHMEGIQWKLIFYRR